ncbi:MAG: hypothetical protein MZV70_11020 [Desulfobacterales bacterium]|nr:hypothetical protein [Desulfobacterales bacterium]
MAGIRGAWTMRAMKFMKKSRVSRNKRPQAGPERLAAALKRAVSAPSAVDRLAHQRISAAGRRSACACARTWISSATMLTAISCGVSAPIEIPMGQWTRRRSSAATPSSISEA